MLITDDKVQAARDRAQAADRELREAERRIGPGKVSEDTAARLSVLLVQARTAAAEADDLAARQSAERVELAARSARESRAALKLSVRKDRLEQSRTALVKAVTEAQAALVRAAEQVAAHNAEVAATIAELTDLGLRLDDVDRAIDHQSGVDGRTVRVSGAYWHRLDEAAVLAWAGGRVAVSRWGVGNNLAETLRNRPGVRDIDLYGLLDDVPDLPPARVVPLVRPAAVPRDAPTVGRGKPFLEQQDRPLKPTPGWQDRWRETYPGVPVPGGDAA